MLRIMRPMLRKQVAGYTVTEGDREGWTTLLGEEPCPMLPVMDGVVSAGPLVVRGEVADPVVAGMPATLRGGLAESECGRPIADTVGSVMVDIDGRESDGCDTTSGPVAMLRSGKETEGSTGKLGKDSDKDPATKGMIPDDGGTADTDPTVVVVNPDDMLGKLGEGCTSGV
jgi:hypothetical protein